MALFVCETTCQWRNRLYRPGEKISYPSEHAADVPHHFVRVDNEPVNTRPQPELVQDEPKAKPRAKASASRDYDAREVAALVGLQGAKRNKLLSDLKIDVPGNAGREDVAKLILDAAKAKGMDPLPKAARARIASEPAQPQLVEGAGEPAAPRRMAAPDEDTEPGGVAIGDTV
jgi:hypothetical protein